MHPDARRAFLVALVLAAASYHATRARLTISGLLDRTSYPQAPFELVYGKPEVKAVTEAAAAAGLQVGETIVTVADRPLRGTGDLALAIQASAPAERLSVEVARAAGNTRLELPMPRPADRPWALGDLMALIALDVVLPLFFMGVGFTVVWFKRGDAAAWLLLFMMSTFSNLSNGGAVFERLGPIAGALCAAWFDFFSYSWAVAMAAFAIAFPERLPLDQRRPWLKWLIFGPLTASILVGVATRLAIFDFNWGSYFISLNRAFGRIALWSTYACMSLFFWTLGVKIGTTKNPDALHRLRILLAGAAVSMTPSAVIATIAVFGNRAYNSSAPEIVRFIAALMMLIFPLTLAYVVIVHKAMGLGVVVRQGLQYALAQRAVRFLQIAVGVAVMWGLVEILADPGKRRVDRLQWMAYGVLFLVFFQRGAEVFKRWIDRRFFREAVDAERILADLGDHVRSIADRHDLLETVSRKIGEALHVDKVAAFIRGESGFVPAFATGYGGEPVSLEFGNAGVLTCCVAALQKPQTVYLDDARSWVRRENIPEADASKLRELQSEVLIPLRTKTAVEGFLSLGPKSSEAAYSPSDLQLLQSVANQTALALDNSRLVEQVASEVAKRERMTREIEIAREVQFTLLPQTPPTIRGLDLAGHCRPAAGIGGDYYDFIPLEGQRAIGLAIGDIAGKGIPAALLMAGLQAALRGQALAGSRDLSRLMVNINKLIFESSPSNRYATFFYGEFRDGTFAYVNAGHNAPILLRRDGSVERLEAGGPVIGLMEFAPFSEGSVEIRPGDLLLGYTDGVSECMNKRDEEWGEDQVIDLLRAERQASSAELVTQIMKSADAFAAGAKQHDDMTLIAMRVQ